MRLYSTRTSCRCLSNTPDPTRRLRMWPLRGIRPWDPARECFTRKRNASYNALHGQSFSSVLPLSLPPCRLALCPASSTSVHVDVVYRDFASQTHWHDRIFSDTTGPQWWERCNLSGLYTSGLPLLHGTTFLQNAPSFTSVAPFSHKRAAAHLCSTPIIWTSSLHQ